MNALTCMPKGVETPEQLPAFYAENRRRLMHKPRAPVATVAALPAPVPALEARRKRLTFLPPPEEPAGSGGVFKGDTCAARTDLLEGWLVDRCEALGLRVADIRSARKTVNLVGWRRYLVCAMKAAFPHASSAEIGLVFNKEGATVRQTLAAMARLAAAGALKEPAPPPSAAASRLLGKKAYRGETMLDYVRRRAREFGLAPEYVRSGGRARALIKVKHLIALELKRNYPNASLKQIAAALGLQDHTTARSAIIKMEALEEKGFPGFESLLEMGA